MPNNKLTFFNTDLRDGRQSPGCKMIDPDSGSIDPILEVAKQLDRTRYDVIEAGFPSAGEKESDIVKAVVQTTSYSTIAAMARMANSKKPGHEYDCMNAAFKALEEAIATGRGRITLLVSTAPLLRKYSLGMSKGEVIENAKTSGKYLVREFDRRKADPDVQFYLEGATDYLDATTIEEQKEELRFLIETARTFINSMALENNGKRDLKLTMSLPDTRGRAVDNEYGKLFEIVQEKIPEIHENGVILSAHAHNDFGLAVSNTLQAVKAGARQVEVTTNGIGERTGNASAVPVALQLHYFGEKFGIKTQGLKMDELDTTAKLVSKVTYDPIRRTEPGIGSNANSTAAGIHESAVAKDPKSYNFIDGKIVGAEPVLLILGPHSGKNALRSVLKEHGIMVSNAVFEKLAWSLKEKTNRDMKPGRFFREFVSRPEIVKMIETDDKQEGGMFLEDQHFSYEKHNDRETVTLRVSKKGHTTPKIESSSHNGVVDAAKKALEKTLDKSMELHVYDPRTFGDDSGATVIVGLTLEMDGQMRRGYGMSADQNTAAVKAMLNALNHFEAEGFTAKLKKV